MASFDAAALAPTLATADFKSIEPHLAQLDKYLTLRTYLGGYTLSEADEKVWIAVRSNKVAVGLIRKAGFANAARWFKYIEEAHPEVKEKAAGPKKAEKKGGANYNIGLSNTEDGVVTRFPPEPSGFLHIGHAKAALLNDYFAKQATNGKLLVRFDDTNPTKEKQEFEDAILHDLELMDIKYVSVTHTSDYFQELYDIAEKMILDGGAYADDTEQETQKDDRKNRLPSKRRDRPAEESLAMFREMKAGTDLGRKHCIRARIAFDSNNGSMRDPVIYRFPNFKDKEPAPHHRTGWTWKIYPTYDFACPVVDSLEGVTHALRTTEYADRNEQYHWFLENLKLRKVNLWEFARINFIRTFLSKRKLTKVVDTGRVTGWDDPRLPTVRGILRRGLTVAALREFMLKQGPSRNIVTMDWTTIWAINKRILDPIVPRFMAVEKKDAVAVTLTNGPESYKEDRPKHAKNPDVGTKKVTFGSKLIIDQADVASFADNEEITLMSWGNAIVRGLDKTSPIKELQLELHLAGDFKTTDKKVTWLSSDEGNLVEAELWEFGYLITKDTLEKDDELDDYLTPVTATMVEALCDANIAELKEGDFLQLERKGYFRVDKALGHGPEGRAVLFKVPTGGKN
ncbi:tRNA synthetases class I, catalytic domain-containing protein [Dactylonectria estremocensis]|uniref:glutamate--tRNA ligase n=1 Tax=Dactylonectria estremocensis TaxID=1079267 RepID=A0A9P9EUX4_9HYPO|nr:tRNA synthetases class I, catalytic domain-containing protein [Dactylonectria estremocensis]